jgi:hypothetical protein
MLVAGGFWYARNAIAIGNPIPQIGSLGPISLPAPDSAYTFRPKFAIVHYWNDPSVWGNWFAPGLHFDLGLLWPVIVLALVAIGVAAVLRGGERVVRMVGAVVLFTAVAYLFTPVGAAGPEGRPIAFEWNVRYLAPALAIAFAILPCLPFARSTARRRTIVLAALLVLFGFTIGSLDQWHQGHVKGAVGAAIAVGVAGLALIWLRGRGYRWRTLGIVPRAAAVLAAALVVTAGLYAEQRHYMNHRYRNTLIGQDLDRALHWARGVHDSRIAVSGIRGIFAQYAFYGSDLSNHVQWVGRPTSNGGFERISTCAGWRRALNRGGYRYVVTTFDPTDPAAVSHPPSELVWTRSDPAARLVLAEGPVHVFRITGRLDPGACDDLPPLTPRERHGAGFGGVVGE